ncbi:uncharacterized protein [Bemisia tabaci]|uniref:uncharacterized protein isoform X1 n=1 Tax=Bemisia tabaci TaxID=7038 RepID=UPI003B281799
MNTIHEDGSVTAAADMENNNTIKCSRVPSTGVAGGDSGDEIRGRAAAETTSCYDSSEPESGIGSSRQNLEEDKTTTDDEERLKLQRAATAVATTVNEKRPTAGFRDDRSAQLKQQGGRQISRLAEGLPRSSSEARIRAPSMAKGMGTPAGRGPLRKPDFFTQQGTVSPLSKHRMQHKRQVTSADLYNKKIPGGTLSRQATSDSLFTTSASMQLHGDAPPLLRKDSKQNLYQKQQLSDSKLGNKRYLLGSSSTGSELSLQAKMLPYHSQLNIPFSNGPFSGSRNDNRGSQFSLSSYPFRNDCEHNNLSMYSQSNSHLDEEQRGEDSQGLTWRRLHMSRAKLKATATTSELLSGFAMIAMVELQINEPTNVPEWLFIMFSICTTILVAVHIFALMISTYLLPNIDAISKLQSTKLVKESPHERMRGFVELAWTFSTVFGLFLFLVEVAILCWVKFWDHSINAAIAATIIVIPVLVIFVIFVFYFYHNLVAFKFKASVSDVKELEAMKKKLDDASPA